jgi:hypothetical protein
MNSLPHPDEGDASRRHPFIKILFVLAGSGVGFITMAGVVPNLPEPQPVLRRLAGLAGGITGAVIGKRESSEKNGWPLQSLTFGPGRISSP